MTLAGTGAVLPDGELLANAASGEHGALAVLYDRYAGPLYAFGLRRLGEPELAEELVSRVMTRVWRHAGRYDSSRGSVRTWLFAIARTAVVDLHRTRPVDAPVATVPDAPDAVDELDALVRAEAVRAALERLTADHREVLELAYYQGLPQAAIAERLGVPLGTVKSRTFYALKAFRLACEELEVVDERM